MKVEYVKRVNAGAGADQHLYRAENGQHYVASSIGVAFDTGAPETLVFESDEDGYITSYQDIAGGRNLSIEEAVADLENVLSGGERGHASPAFTEGGMLEGLSFLLED